MFDDERIKLVELPLRMLVAPHGWGNLAGRVDTPALPLKGAEGSLGP